MPHAHAAARTACAAPPERVWETVADPHQLPRWWPRVGRVEGGHRRALHGGAAPPRTGAPLRADFRVLEARAVERRALGPGGRRAPPSSASSSARAPRSSCCPTARARRWSSWCASACAAGPAWAASWCAGRPRACSTRRSTPWRSCMGREMRWWGWGEDAHAGSVSEAALAWLEGELGGPRRAPRPRRARRRAPPGPAAARRRPRPLRRHPARRPRRARAPCPRQVLSRPRAPARGRLHGRAGRRPDAARPRRGARRAGGMRGRGRRGGALRRRDERGQRPSSPTPTPTAGATRRRTRARPRPPCTSRRATRTSRSR